MEKIVGKNNRSKRLRVGSLILAGATLSAILIAPVAGAANLSNSSFAVRAVNSQQTGVSAVKPGFKADPTATPAPTSPPVTTPTPTPTAPEPVMSATTVAITIDTSLPGCMASPFDLEVTGASNSISTDWGDQSTPTKVTGAGRFSHSYAPGKYSLTLDGKIQGLVRNSTAASGSTNCILSVDHFGNSVGLKSLSGLLRNAQNVQHVVAPPSTVTDLSGMFRGAKSYNEDLSGWNTANVTDFNNMFNGAAKFNGNVSNWNTASVTASYLMFSGATSFNQDLSKWNVSKVVNFNRMFDGATAFNGDVSTWTLTSANYMTGMFEGATSFNQNIGSWSMNRVLNTNEMFQGATSFNSNISGWNTSLVTDMTNMFDGASSFKQNISNWTVDRVTTWAPFSNGSGMTSAQKPAKFR